MNKGHQIFKRMQGVARLQGGSGNFDPATWADPGPLPSPTPDPSVYMNQWPSGFTNNSTPNMNIPLVPPPNLPYISNGGLFGSNNWPAWVRYGVGAIPYAGPAFNAARTGYNIFDRIRWAMTQPKLPSGSPADDGGTPSDSGSADTGTAAPPPPSGGVGIDPMGRPAGPTEWWSNDFGRWNTDPFGSTPGNYNLAGPGGGMGQRGTGFGSGTATNLQTAIGLDTLGRGGGQANFSGAWGGGPAAAQMRQIMKGIYSPMTSEGYQPLSALTGTAPLSGAQNIAGQQQLHDLLMANPGAMGGPVSGPMLRGGSRIPIQTAQGGTNDVRGKEPPFAEDGKWWWEKGVPLRPMSEMPDNEEDLSPEELRREQEDYKRRVKESQYIQAQKGTSNIMGMQTTANNPGMKLFMGRIKGVRPKLLLPHPSRARLPNAAQLAQSVETPIGVKKGSSGIHIKPSHKGLFTAKAKSAGMGVQGYASKVLSEGSGASAATRRQANFAKNARSWKH